MEFKRYLLLAGLALHICGDAVFGNPTPTVDELKTSTNYIMSLPAEEVQAMVPKSRGISWTPCPHCHKRTRTALWEWSPERPNEIACKDCGTIFPNEQYPDKNFVEVESPEGPLKFYYYEKPLKAAGSGAAQKEGVDFQRFFFRATADWQAKEYLSNQARDLALLYQKTGDERFAKMAFVILREFARVFPGYPAITDGNRYGEPHVFKPGNDPQVGEYPSRWSFWTYMDVSQELLSAYQAMASWPGWQTVDGKKADEMIKRDLFDAQIERVQAVPEVFSNMSIAHKWPSLLLAARVLHRPDLFRKTMHDVKTFLDEHFLYDGSWKETSPSYGRMTLGGLWRVRDLADGYSDPAGYIDPDTGSRIDNFDSQRMLSGIGKLERSLTAARLPDGRFLPINDTWPDGLFLDPSEQTQSTLIPGLGVALLGGGTKDEQVLGYLNDTSGRSHKHFDALSIGIFAHGKELLPSLGYTHTRYRRWAISTMSKNTVAVNGRDSRYDLDHTENRLLLYVTDGDIFHMASAESQSAYPKITEQYERSLILVGRSSKDAYFIDLFDIQGGRQHDYLLHGSADEDSEVQVEGVALEPWDGTLMNPNAKFIPPRKQRDDAGGPESAYGFVKDLKKGEELHNGQVLLTMGLKSDPKVAIQSRLFSEKGDTFVLGWSPRVRSAGGKFLDENDALLDRYQSPMLCWRRQGNDLTSHFVAIHQALPSQVALHAAERSTLADGTLLLRVDRGPEGIDYFLKPSDGTHLVETNTPDGKLSFQGLIGFVRMKGGVVQNAVLVGSGKLQLGEFELSNKNGTYQGTVKAVDYLDEAGGGGSFEVADKLPSEGVYSNLQIQFADGTERSYNIVKIKSLPEGSRIFVKERPGFSVREDGVELTSFPKRHIAGSSLKYRFHLLTEWKAK